MLIKLWHISNTLMSCWLYFIFMLLMKEIQNVKIFTNSSWQFFSHSLKQSHIFFAFFPLLMQQHKYATKILLSNLIVWNFLINKKVKIHIGFLFLFSCVNSVLIYIFYSIKSQFLLILFNLVFFLLTSFK